MVNPMEPRYEARLKELTGPWCTADLVADLLGLDLLSDPRLVGAVRAWAARFRGDAVVVVGWFLDFVYRNFFYDHWIVWAELVWDDWCRERTLPNRWPRLIHAFDQPEIVGHAWRAAGIGAATCVQCGWLGTSGARTGCFAT